MWSPWQRVVRDLHWLLPCSARSATRHHHILALALSQPGPPAQCSAAHSAPGSRIAPLPASRAPPSIAHTAGFATEPATHTDWRQHTRTKFSVRPSLLSPLFSTYLLEIRKDHRRTTLSHLLEAHKLLSAEIEGLDAPQIERTAQYRVQQLQQLSSELQALAHRSNITTCTQRSQMLAYFTLLEKQLHASEEGREAAPAGEAADGAAAAPATDAQLFYDLSHGRVNVWDAWQTQFIDRYKDAPSLPSLESIYREEYEREQAKTSALEAAENAETGKKHVPGYPKPKMDVAGTVWAEGRRKSAVGQVLVKPGVGRITVNGLPYDVFFLNILDRQAFLLPLLSLPHLSTAFDIEATVENGGITGQAHALRMALARALRLFQSRVPPTSEPALQYLSAPDRRVKERKKIGRHRARKGFTYVRR